MTFTCTKCGKMFLLVSYNDHVQKHLQGYLGRWNKRVKVRSTYVLSLPKRWMIEMHLKAGDPVTIVRESNNSLSIIPNAVRLPDSAKEVTAVVLQNESGSSLKRKVVSMYLAGYNIMHLKSKTGRINASQRDAVREVVRRNLVGSEMINHIAFMCAVR